MKVIDDSHNVFYLMWCPGTDDEYSLLTKRNVVDNYIHQKLIIDKIDISYWFYRINTTSRIIVNEHDKEFIYEDKHSYRYVNLFRYANHRESENKECSDISPLFKFIKEEIYLKNEGIGIGSNDSRFGIFCKRYKCYNRGNNNLVELRRSNGSVCIELKKFGVPMTSGDRKIVVSWGCLDKIFRCNGWIEDEKPKKKTFKEYYQDPEFRKRHLEYMNQRSMCEACKILVSRSNSHAHKLTKKHIRNSEAGSGSTDLDELKKILVLVERRIKAIEQNEC